MKKTAFVGVDIKYDKLNLAWVSGNTVKETVSVRMPENLLKKGEVVSPDAMSDLIREAMKKGKIRCADAALVLSTENYYIRTLNMPRMTEAQLNYNLPFEFKDYITTELKDYYFDYEVLPQKADSEPDTMDLLAATSSKAYIEEMRGILRKAGLKLIKAAPDVCGYEAILRKKGSGGEREHCLNDLGYREITMNFFKDGNYSITRRLQSGIADIDRVVADAYHVDEHVAHTYLEENYKNCQDDPACLEAYGNIVVDLQRALNFYRFSNQDSELTDVWVCGSGCHITPLIEQIEGLDVEVHFGSELVPDGRSKEDCDAALCAIGLAYTEE